MIEDNQIIEQIIPKKRGRKKKDISIKKWVQTDAEDPKIVNGKIVLDFYNF